MKTLNLVLVMLVFAGNAFAADPLTERLQRGLFEEEANHNLDAAIKEYQSVVTQSDEQRKVIATALFRLGECYRKLGRTNDANAQYQRILRDFAEQEQLVRLSGDLLKPTRTATATVSGPGAAVPSWKTVTDPEQVRLLQEEIKLAEQQVATVEKHHAAGVEPLASVLNAKRDVLAVRRLLPDNSSLSRQKSLLDEQVKIVEQLLKEAEQRVKVGVVPPTEPIPLRRELLTLQREMASLAESTTVGTTITPAPTTLTQAEAEELARVKTLARNSPDLLHPRPGTLSELQKAARAGHFSVAEFLLSQGVKANDPASGSALVEAAQRGHLRIVQLLLDHGATTNAASAALISACESGFKSVADLLISRGADVNQRSSLNMTPLHFATYVGHGAIVEMLLKHGAQLDVLSTGNNNPNGWPEYVVQGAAPLHLAVERGYAGIVEQLLAAGANVGLTNRNGRAPLHLAAARGNTNLCALLLERGANPNIVMTTSMTPLAFALESQSSETVALLLQKGTDANAPTAENPRFVFYPLHRAVGHRSVPLLMVMLAAKPNLEVINGDNFTPLQMAIGNNYDEMADLLLKAGANPNRVFREGYSPLHSAVTGGRVPLVAGLLKAGAKPNVVNGNGETPLSLALASLQRMSSASPRNVTSPGQLMLNPADGISYQWHAGIPGNPGSPPPATKDDLEKIVALLRERGADEFLQRRGFISAVRGPQVRVNIFSKGTNDVNRYTLMEFLAAVYENTGSDLPFPDFGKVVIYRLEGKTEKPLLVNVAMLMATTNCAGDLPLEWGDNVEIPMADHRVNAQWYGVAATEYGGADPQSATLSSCLQRTVRFSAGGTNVAIPLGVWILDTRTGHSAKARQPLFRLSSVVLRDDRFRNLLRSSSDLSRVTVTRLDPQTKEIEKMTFDLNAVALPDMSYSGNPPPIPWAHDLWLRDGDVIEVPEKP